MSHEYSPAVPGPADGAADGGRALALDEPVVVLTTARSGSTLLRFLLDTHADLACPPETSLVATAVQLADRWRLLNDDSSGSAPEPDAKTPPDAGQEDAGQEQVRMSAGAIEMVRGVLDAMFSPYLASRGKRRWCDKSLGTAQHAEAFSLMYPRARFVCLYRHCMDVVASGLEACPWGVAGYGFDAYVCNTPGNNAAALAHYWADHTAAVLEFEQANPGICLRVRYEDLVADPQAMAGKIFSFLGVSEVPRIGDLCFSAEHDTGGPADYKIWATGEISTDSVGRGFRVPPRVIPAPLRDVINDLLGKLDYTLVDEHWSERGGQPVAVEPDLGDGRATHPDLDVLDELLTGRIVGGRRSANSPREVAIRARAVNGSVYQRTWHVDLEQGTVSRLADDVSPDPAWLIAGDHRAWLAVLTGATNLGVALRRGDLAISNVAANAVPREDESLQLIARALGLS